MGALNDNEILGSLAGLLPYHINDTNEHTGRFTSIQTLEDCYIDTLDSNMEGNSLTFIPGGTIIGGVFTKIKLTSGELIAYKEYKGVG